MAKFEANIPSYLKSGAGSVPIDNNFEKITDQPENLSVVIDNYTMEKDEILTTPMLDPAQIKRPQVQEVQAPQQPLMDDDILIA